MKSTLDDVMSVQLFNIPGDAFYMVLNSLLYKLLLGACHCLLVLLLVVHTLNASVPAVSTPEKPSAGACIPRYSLFNTTVPSPSITASTIQAGSSGLRFKRLFRSAGVR